MVCFVYYWTSMYSIYRRHNFTTHSAITAIGSNDYQRLCTECILTRIVTKQHTHVVSAPYSTHTTHKPNTPKTHIITMHTVLNTYLLKPIVANGGRGISFTNKPRRINNTPLARTERDGLNCVASVLLLYRGYNCTTCKSKFHHTHTHTAAPKPLQPRQQHLHTDRA